MKAKKKSARRRNAGDAGVRSAIRSGRSIAQEVLEFRNTQSRKRAAIAREFKATTKFESIKAAPSIPARTLERLGSRESAGVLIAEGDSWFDYPFHDVLQLLEDEHLFDVESVAHKGDCVEDMAHSGGQFEEFARRLEKLLRSNKVPRAILLSGGGNDIAGDEFALLLNHAASSLPALNEDIMRGVIDVRLRAAYARMISGLTTITESYLGKPIPIITHGYDYALPDGRGFLGGALFLPGPWLEPGFRKKGYVDFAANSALMITLMDRFNSMLKEVSATPQFAHVHYLNLRDTLIRDKGYKKDWANELHPTKEGFRKVTQKFAELIGRL